ncbi:MAG: TonB-dependent receptor [Chitinophagaceae bacterium]|nr:TonB-dependent receptor [Rubrivivax sp.]
MHHQSWMGFSRTAVAVAVAVVAAAPVLAQNTTSNLSGRVVGADGKPVAGAAVSIVHVESGSTSGAVTDTDGRYFARGLRVGGPFTVTFSKDGTSDKREGIFLQLAETATLDTQLGSATGASATIVVTGRGVSDKFNRSNMGAGTNIGQREINTLASIQRNLQDYARLDPRLAQTDKERGEISAAGQNIRFNSITVDGVNINDTFGLEANNLPTRKQPISIDAIQSVQVNVANYDVTQKGYTGANINAVTKSGTNEFKGSVYYIWRDENLVGKFYNRGTGAYSEFPPFKEDTKGFTLGGPIIQDKLFFFANYEEFTSTRSAPAFGPAGSGLTNVGISQSAIDSAISIGRSAHNIDLGSSQVPSSLELKVEDTTLKLDWNISDNHRANLRYNNVEQSEPNIVGLSGTGLSLSSWWYVTDKTIETLVGQWFADWSPTFSTELKISQRDYAQRHTPVNGTRLPAIGLRFDGALPAGAVGANTAARFLNAGTELSRQFNVLDTKTSDLYLGGNLALGAHELKFGVDYQNNEIFNAFLQNVNGNYTFARENSSASITYSFGAITCSTATAAQVEAAVLENFRLGRPSAYTVQLPRAGKTLDDGAANFKIANTGVFMQDSWRITETLNVMFGVRLDQQGVNTAPIFNAGAAAAPVAGSVSGNTFTRATGGFGIDNSVTLDGNNLVQPRVGFNWNLGGERRTQLRGGVGLFQGAAASVWLSNPFSNTGAAVAQFNCASFTACAAANARFSANPDTQPTLTGTPPAAAVDAISPDLEQPSVWKANLAFETELPALPVVGTLVAGVEWLHTRTNTGIYYQNLNLGNPTRLGRDGRELYYRAEGLNPACYTVAANGNVTNVTTGACATPAGQTRTRALSNPNFANVIIAQDTDKGVGNALTLSLSRPVAQGLGWGIAYTRTSATEVSPLTSSTSNSNWNGKSIFNPNEEVTQNSNYLIRDRFSANITWSQAFISSYRTSVGVFYEGRRGKPYSWTYINDLNGDAISGNDLMYIPSAPGSGEVVFRGGAAEEARFWEIVEANPGLSNAKGGVVGRNNNYAPWVNNIDLRLTQEMPGFAKSHKATFALDFLNFGNLLNKRWGRIDEVAFPSRRSFVNHVGLDAQGRYVYSLGTVTDLTTKQAERESQWAIQATVRYEF